MKKKVSALLLVFFVLTLFQTTIADAPAGTYASPFSAWTEHTYVSQNAIADIPKAVESDIMWMYTGQDAQSIIEEEDPGAPSAAAGQRWIVLVYHFHYASGTGTFKPSDAISGTTSFYNANGTQITPIATASFSGPRSQLESVVPDNTPLNVGDDVLVLYGILVPTSVGYPYIRVNSGFDGSASSPVYTWSTTDPEDIFYRNTPTNIKAVSNGFDSVKLTWAADDEADGYQVYRSTSSSGAYTYLGTTTSAGYTDTGLTTNSTYYYEILTVVSLGTPYMYSHLSVPVSAKPVATVPGSVKAASAGYSSIKVTWGKVSGASGYQVFRSGSSNGTYSLISTTSSTSLTNTGLKTNTTYYYKVKAYRVVGSSKIYSGYSSAAGAKPIPGTPGSFKVARASSSSIKVSWSAVAGASGYQVLRSASANGTYTSVKATSSTSFANTGLVKGRAYFYKVRAYRTVSGAMVYGGCTAVLSAKP
ncbi:MAG: hypothetical protein P4M02_04485 [Clostridia bacterium]|nr:hypothetical protein [Clostridia bacterium]